jgi:hypothetical protein
MIAADQDAAYVDRYGESSPCGLRIRGDEHPLVLRFSCGE